MRRWQTGSLRPGRDAQVQRGRHERRWMRRLSTFGGLLVCAFALVAAPAAAAPSGAVPSGGTATKAFSFVCLQPVSVCEEAGRRAGGSAAEVEKYLRAYEASKATAADFSVNVGAPGGFGRTTDTGDGRLYFGWKLSNGGFGRQLPAMRCQYLPTGQPVNCQNLGNIGFQATFKLQNRFIQIDTVVKNFIPEPFRVASAYECSGPSAGCGGVNFLGPSRLDAEEVAPFRFRTFQLRSAGDHDVSFQWAVYDSVTGTVGVTPVYDSLDFTCTRFNSSADPGECFYNGFQQGDAT